MVVTVLEETIGPLDVCVLKCVCVHVLARCAQENGGRSPLLSIPLAALTALIYLRMKPLKIYGRSFSWPWRMLKASKVWIKEGLGVRAPPFQQGPRALLHLPSRLLQSPWQKQLPGLALEPSLSGPCPSSAREPSPAQVPPPHRR